MIFFVAGLASPVSAQDADATAEEDAFDRAYREYNQSTQEGNFSAAEEPARRALELGREKFGPNSRQAGDLLYNYGLVLNRRQKSAEATKVLKEALPIWESVHGPNAPALIDILMELAMASVRSFESNLPFTYFSRAKEIAANAYGAKGEILVDLHLEFANALFLIGQYESKKYFEEAYALSRDAFPEGNYRTGVAAFGLGKILMSNANRKKAEPYFVEAIDFFEISSPPNPV
ncbi:MAG TPA: tetratricopeptide repeat protein, partial [Sphingomonadales bacterium]|nr:tetratricopeptide repeat protein [Sphingomonadales bacterium]